MARILMMAAAVWAACGGAFAEDDALRPETPPCFPGAYYRKAVSSQADWSGIEGIVRLPQPHYDDTRRNPKTGRPLDNASIYMGGRSDEAEIDAGVNWEIIRLADGTVTTEGKAFRPFWRNEQWASGPARPEFYFQPGDRLRMLCATTTEPGKLRMEIELLSRRDAETSRDVPPPAGEGSLSVEFDAPGFGPGCLQEFKRVNAIDQSGNEGKEVAPTTAQVVGAEWEEVVLLRRGERIPFGPERFADMRCPAPGHIRVELAGEPGRGGERITISGEGFSGAGPGRGE